MHNTINNPLSTKYTNNSNTRSGHVSMAGAKFMIKRNKSPIHI